MSIKKEFVLISEIAQQSISQVSKQFQNFIDDHHKAIEEIKKLSDDEPIQEMMRIVNTVLPEANPSDIVKSWIMQHSNSSYESYVKKESTGRNASIGTTLSEKYKPIYLEHQQSFFDEQELKWKLWIYRFALKDLEYTVDGSAPTKISMTHKNEMSPYVTFFSDKSKHGVDEDEVGLESFKSEIAWSYMNKNIHDMTRHFDLEYWKVMDRYVPSHHIPAINQLSDYLGGFM